MSPLPLLESHHQTEWENDEIWAVAGILPCFRSVGNIQGKVQIPADMFVLFMIDHRLFCSSHRTEAAFSSGCALQFRVSLWIGIPILEALTMVKTGGGDTRSEHTRSWRRHSTAIMWKPFAKTPWPFFKFVISWASTADLSWIVLEANNSLTVSVGLTESYARRHTSALLVVRGRLS